MSSSEFSREVAAATWQRRSRQGFSNKLDGYLSLVDLLMASASRTWC
jgi:hypothetical protein